MSTLNLKRIMTHHWLKYPTQQCFHAYLSRTSGSAAVCENNLMITDLNIMLIPGERSMCCNHCFKKLYGIDPYATARETI